MRNELELIEKIENYLKNQLSDPEKVQFEEEMAKNPALREEVRLQETILKGVDRLAWKQRVRQAGIRRRIRRNFRNWGSAGFAVLVLAAAILYYKGVNPGRPNGYEGDTLPALNESGSHQWADADKNLPAQTFLLDASGDTVIETRGGITLSVPSNAFIHADGGPVIGKISLIVKEALDPASILKAGLSSRSADRLLESGGMFFLDARQDGQPLKIDPTHGIYTEIPTDSARPGMNLFTGRRLPNGTIDWVDPRPLEHGLVPVDIHLLDFYPPHYLDSLAKWGTNAHDKRFTDSLYYSFARRFGVQKGDTSEFVNPFCAINPAKIKAIWDYRFQNTLLSTREFEERMPWIHRSGEKILDLYVNNLDKDLSSIDSMAAGLSIGDGAMPSYRDQFLSFWARHDGKVNAGSKQFQKLKAYYEMKTKAYTEAITKTQNEFWNRQNELDETAYSKRSLHEADSMKDANKNFDEEYALNLNNALTQLGYDTTLPFRTPATRVYAVMVTNTGWCNIDRAVYASTGNRTTLDYTDPQSGKKAVIKYLPVSFLVNDPSAYDRIYLYLLSDKLSSFIRLSGTAGKYADRLDELMKYCVVCIAWKNEQAFYYTQENIQPKDYPPFALTKIDSAELDRRLNALGNASQHASLEKENLFIRFDIRDQKRQDRNEALRELTDKAIRVIFPCIVICPEEGIK